jgi:hypothetical protein
VYLSVYGSVDAHFFNILKSKPDTVRNAKTKILFKVDKMLGKHGCLASGNPAQLLNICNRA